MRGILATPFHSTRLPFELYSANFTQGFSWYSLRMFTRHVFKTRTYRQWMFKWSHHVAPGSTFSCSTHCIYRFCTDLRTNSDCYSVQHLQNGLYNRDGECLLRGTSRVFKYSSGSCWCSKGSFFRGEGRVLYHYSRWSYVLGHVGQIIRQCKHKNVKLLNVVIEIGRYIFQYRIVEGMFSIM